MSHLMTITADNGYYLYFNFIFYYKSRLNLKSCNVKLNNNNAARCRSISDFFGIVSSDLKNTLILIILKMFRNLPEHTAQLFNKKYFN